jgi:hypothetical protein
MSDVVVKVLEIVCYGFIILMSVYSYSETTKSVDRFWEMMSDERYDQSRKLTICLNKVEQNFHRDHYIDACIIICTWALIINRLR